VINGASAWLSQLFLHDWLLVMATALIVVIRFRPSGLLGGVGRLEPPAENVAAETQSVAIVEAHSG
jgi:hypothetical protein